MHPSETLLESSTRPVAVVTGASSGIGAAWARRLAAEGFDLLLTARRVDRLDSLAAELRRSGAAVVVHPADLADDEERRNLCALVSALPRLEALVHDAGFGVTGSVGTADTAKLSAMARVHVLATIELCAAAMPRLRGIGRGRIVVVSSIAGWLHGAGSATYCATKAFQTSFARSLAREGKPFGIRILALCPGYTRTEFHDTPEYADWDRGHVPTWMWSSAEEVVDAAWRDLDRGRAVCIPGLVNKLVVFSMSSGILGIVRERIRRRGPKAED